MMRVLVAGGAGFIGSHVCEELLRRGDEAICLDNMITGRFDHIDHLQSHPDFSFLQEEAARAPLLRVDVVIHLASPGVSDGGNSLSMETLLANSAGTHRLLAMASDVGARFVYVSSSDAYAGPASAVSDDAVAKRFGEALTWAYADRRGVYASVARVAAVYGPRMDRASSLEGCYVSDAVDALLHIAGDPHAEGMTFEIAATDVGSHALRDRYGWSPKISADEGFRRTMAYFADEGVLEAVA